MANYCICGGKSSKCEREMDIESERCEYATKLNYDVYQYALASNDSDKYIIPNLFDSTIQSGHETERERVDVRTSLSLQHRQLTHHNDSDMIKYLTCLPNFNNTTHMHADIHANKAINKFRKQTANNAFAQ